VEAARRLPELDFVFATRHLVNEPSLPANIYARQLTHEQFVNEMRAASVVVVPIQPGLRRAAGQQSYLNAMYLGKPTVVTDTFGVRDHVEDGVTGLIVDGSAKQYVDVLRWLFAATNRATVTGMGQRAREYVMERFTPEQHARCVLDTARALFEGDGNSRLGCG
jgi:glycosyltransferase involved in cell wall biosynthesis